MTGGTSRAFLSEGDASPSWSPDGTRLVYFNNKADDPLYVADRTGADASPLEIAVADPHMRPTQPCNRFEPDAVVYNDAAKAGPVTAQSVD